MRFVKFFIATIAIASILFLLSCKKESSTTLKKAVQLFYTMYTDSVVGSIDLEHGSINSVIANSSNGLSRGVEGIFYYDKNNTLYVADEWSNKILSISLSGTVTELFNIADGVSAPTSIAVNPSNNKIYFCNSDTKNILVGNLDGSGTPTPLFASAKGPDYGYGLILDPDRNKLYFSEFGYGSSDPRNGIYVANLDGSGDTTVLYRNIDATTGLTYPSGIAIDLSHNKIYWCDERENNIVSANLDGSGGFTTLFDNATDGVNRADGLAIDLTSGKIYWTETKSGYERIRYGNIDGSGTPATLLDGTATSSESYCITLRLE